jgi:hypothetical protein
MAPTNVRVAESTENILAGRRVRDVSDTIMYLDPNENPFVLLSKEANSRTVTNTKYEWIEKLLPNKIDNVNGTTGTGTSVIMDDGTQYYVGDLVLVKRTGEIMRLTSFDGTHTWTVVRAVGSVTVAALADNDDLFGIGNANAEGGSLGTPRSVLETQPYNYTQIFREPFGFTTSEQASENYGGRDEPRQIREHAIYHAMDLENAFIKGQRNIDTTDTGAPIRYTGGFIYYLTGYNSSPSSNVVAISGTLTEPALENFMQIVFQPTGGGQTRVLFASPLIVSVIDQLAAGRLQTVPSDKTFGIAVNQWLTSHGTMNIIKHRMLNAGTGTSGGSTGFTGTALAVDPSRISYCPLRDNDTKLRRDVGTPGDLKTTHEYVTEAGFQVSNPEVHGMLTGITG